MSVFLQLYSVALTYRDLPYQVPNIMSIFMA